MSTLKRKIRAKVERERRRDERRPLDRPAQIAEAGSQLEPKRLWSGRVRDLSRSGLGLLSEFDVPVGTMLWVRVPDAGRSRLILGEVTRCERGEAESVLGIECRDLEAAAGPLPRGATID